MPKLPLYARIPLLTRLPVPGPRVRRAVGVAAVVTQGGIGVTGSVVRVTGSGLGCTVWPECQPGSVFPVRNTEVAGLHQWIEFTNRMLFGVIGIVAVLALLTALRIAAEQPERRRLVWLGLAMPAGVLAQGVIGGLTVLTHLLWWTVALHFLASAVLVWTSVVLLHAFTEGDAAPQWRVPAAARMLLVGIGGLLALALIAGTTVTGAGPHAGDAKAPRLHAPIEALAKGHGTLVVLLLAAVLLLGTMLRGHADTRIWRRYWLVVLAVLAQGTLGVVQYALGVPPALVSLHVLGAALVIAATSALWCAARIRAPLTPLVSAEREVATV